MEDPASVVSGPKLSLIIPAYKEGEHIYDNLKVIASALADIDCEIIPVNDGSPDSTGSEIDRAASEDPRIRPVSYPVNRGKGGAIKAGIEASTGDVVGFLDADLDIAPDHVAVFYSEMEKGGSDVVIGSKMHKDSKLEYPFARKIFSIGYFCLLKILFGTGLKDTQTGVKLYKGDLLRSIGPLLKVEGYAFDIEMLMLAASRGARITEMPVKVEYTRDTSFGRIRFKDVWKMFTDTWGIWWDLRIAKRYGK